MRTPDRGAEDVFTLKIKMRLQGHDAHVFALTTQKEMKHDNGSLTVIWHRSSHV